MSSASDPDFVHMEGGSAAVRFQTSVYGLDAIAAAAHRLTDRCHVHIESEQQGSVLVRIKPKSTLESARVLAGELANHVLDQSLRVRLASETEPIRRVLLAQVFSKVNILRPDLDDAPPQDRTGSGGQGP